MVYIFSVFAHKGLIYVKNDGFLYTYFHKSLAILQISL